MLLEPGLIYDCFACGSLFINSMCCSQSSLHVRGSGKVFYITSYGFYSGLRYMWSPSTEYPKLNADGVMHLFMMQVRCPSSVTKLFWLSYVRILVLTQLELSQVELELCHWSCLIGFLLCAFPFSTSKRIAAPIYLSFVNPCIFLSIFSLSL